MTFTIPHPTSARATRLRENPVPRTHVNRPNTTFLRSGRRSGPATWEAVLTNQSLQVTLFTRLQQLLSTSENNKQHRCGSFHSVDHSTNSGFGGLTTTASHAEDFLPAVLPHLWSLIEPHLWLGLLQTFSDPSLERLCCTMMYHDVGGREFGIACMGEAGSRTIQQYNANRDIVQAGPTECLLLARLPRRHRTATA